MNRRIFRVSMLALAINGLITLHSPADSLEVIVLRVVLVVILALAIIPKDTPCAVTTAVSPYPSMNPAPCTRCAPRKSAPTP